LDAQGAADAARFVDHRDAARSFDAVAGVESPVFASEELRERARARLASRRTLVDARAAGGDRLGVGAAARVAAFPALGLRQQRTDPVGQRGAHAAPSRGFQPPAASPRTISPARRGPWYISAVYNCTRSAPASSFSRASRALAMPPTPMMATRA